VTQALDLPLPVLINATGTGANVTYAPLQGVNGAKVRVSYPDMNTGDSIRLVMAGTPGAGSPTIAPKPGETDKTVEFDIPASAIAANIGATNKTFTLQYQVTRGGGSPNPSGTVTVTVTPIHLSNLPRVQINKTSHGGTLNVGQLSGNGQAATINPWPFSKAGQKVWISISGTTGSLKVLDGYSITEAEAANGLANKPVQRAWLQSQAHHREIIVLFKIGLNGAQTESEAITSRLTNYIISKMHGVVVDYTPFDNRSYNGWTTGPAVQPGDLSFKELGGRLRLFNYTTTNNSAGILLRKTINNLVVGREYQFTVSVLNANIPPVIFYPRISLETSQGQLTSPLTLIGSYWLQISGVFTAASSSIELRFVSHQADGNGNDYYMSDFKLEY
uniref:hypothetical protein n=1 Tax=Pseudomonas sp. Irchel 3E20 TaxID=2008983 RepID=UPI0015950546